MRRYQTPHALAPVTGAVITDTLETIAREGARRMLEHALRAEVDERLDAPATNAGPRSPAIATATPARARSASGPGRCPSGRPG